MKFWLFLCFVALSVKAFSQERVMAGIVFDKSNKFRVAKVVVKNLTTGESVYDNLNGVFSINAGTGDLLVFSKSDYYDDTVKVENHIPIAVYLSKPPNQLREVTIRDTAMTPEKKLAATKQEYSRAYGLLANKDMIGVGGTGGAGLSIDALWNSISREGKDAAKTRAYIERDYREDVIDYRFNRKLVTRITGLQDKKLTDFMQKYRPGYYFVLKATDYEFISSIKTNYRRYQRNPQARSQPSILFQDNKQ
jgi:hypothetical protein